MKRIRRRSIYMNNDNVNQSMYDLFKNTYEHCGTFLLHLSDEEIGWHLFEEFDGDCISFLHKDNIEALRQTGKITEESARLAIELSDRFRALENTELWNVPSVKENTKWLEILKLSDRVRASLTRKTGDPAASN